jgi:hypothetical protein
MCIDVYGHEDAKFVSSSSILEKFHVVQLWIRIFTGLLQRECKFCDLKPLWLDVVPHSP